CADDLDNLGYGVGQARRGWLTRHDVLNTRTLAQLRPLLARTMGGAGSAGGTSKRDRPKGA
ncbi:DNA polymerase/3'-5' exonuclease PolX, partial [Burkholderia sp. Tr-862]|nr:DNA polymerase/3'-5' exonuclease PolX [Burkholderia sp. Tr-862]